MTPRLIALCGCLAFGLGVPPVQAGEPVTLQLRWLHQAQFAGYYMALHKGFYQQAGLDVTGNPP